jgi:radical SAM family uncharacterized protein/radical SAM-linked protein
MMDVLPFSIQKPGRYVASEINARRKDFDSARTRFLLAFPDVYEVGMSHLGLHLLYHLLNDMEGVMADRAYTPWLDYEAFLRDRGQPLRSHESRRVLREFDFVGFSLQYELSYTNILTMLDLGAIPLRSRDRGPDSPWVIAGGPCAFNPEPLADFFDFVVLGEAEDVLREIVAIHQDWRGAQGGRSEFLRAVAGLAGVYVPSFFDVTYDGSHGVLRSIEPRVPGYETVRKRLVMDLDRRSPTPVRPLVPMGDIVHNRLSMEIARGCTRGCRFCQAGYIYRPVRERQPELLVAASAEALQNSGFEEISLLSFSTGDYCRIQPLLSALMDQTADGKVAVSFPSMRVGTLTSELMELVRRVRKTGFTLAPEAGSERLRRVINKAISDDDLLQTAETAFSLGWKVLKLYFMIGLPSEDEADLDALCGLSHRVWRLARKRKASINVAVSTFVPKPLTPFQWHPQLPKASIEERLESIRERMNRPGLRLKWNDPGQSVLEAVFARGDRRLTNVLERAYLLGARFDGWGEQYRPKVWDNAFEACGIDPRFYTERDRPLEEVLPWQHLSSGVERSFLVDELQRSRAEVLTPDCRWDACSACGVCDHREVLPQLQDSGATLPKGPGQARASAQSESQFQYLLEYSKLGVLRYYGQLEIAQGFIRAVRRSGLPAVYSSGFHPHLKLSFDEALPLGMESLSEHAILTLNRRMEPEKVREELNRVMPDGLCVQNVVALRRRRERPSRVCVTYRVRGLAEAHLGELMLAWGQKLGETISKETKRGRHFAPLGDILLEMRRVDECTVEMDLIEAKDLCFRPLSVLRHLLPDCLQDLGELRICKMSVSGCGEFQRRPVSIPDIGEGRCTECPPRSS